MDPIAEKLPHGVQITPLRIIPTENGDVLHALKASEDSYRSFGEAYFSTVLPGKTKGWKKHIRMVLNMVVPVGEIRFVLVDDRTDSKTRGSIFECTLSRNNYMRLTIPPGIWVAFQGKGRGENILLNLASIPHDPTEAENLPLINEYINFNWS